jgi:hypothetical protein
MCGIFARCSPMRDSATMLPDAKRLTVVSARRSECLTPIALTYGAR